MTNEFPVRTVLIAFTLAFVSAVGYGAFLPITSTWLDVLSSLGSFMGGIGALLTVYVAYKALNSWREQEQKKELYKTLCDIESELKMMLHNTKNLISHNILLKQQISGELRLPDELVQQIRGKVLLYKNDLDLNFTLLSKTLECFELKFPNDFSVLNVTADHIAELKGNVDNANEADTVSALQISGTLTTKINIHLAQMAITIGRVY